MLKKTTPLEDDYKTSKGKGSTTRTGYTIEARIYDCDPEMIGRKIYDERWRQVEFDKSAIGVPMNEIHHRELIEQGLLSYSAAQALRWWFHAQAEIEGSCKAIGLQTRLVQHRVYCTHEVLAIGFIDEEDSH